MNARAVARAIALLFAHAVAADAAPIIFGTPLIAHTTLDASNPHPEGIGAYDAGGGSPTITLVEGGFAASAMMYDESKLNVTDGTLGVWTQLSDESQFSLSGGTVEGQVTLRDGAVFIMTGGSLATARLPNSEGGDIVAEGAATVFIKGGRFGAPNVIGSIELYDESRLDVFGTGLQLNISPSGSFSVTGLLADGQPSNIFGVLGSQATVYVHNVPEPAVMILAGFLPLALRQAAGPLSRTGSSRQR